MDCRLAMEVEAELPEVSLMLSDRCARRRRADNRTLARHRAVAFDHIRCWERARFRSSVSESESSSAYDEDDAARFFCSKSCMARARARRFLRQTMQPIMKPQMMMASTRERTRIMAVRTWLSLLFGGQPGGSCDGMSAVSGSTVVCVTAVAVCEGWT